MDVTAFTQLVGSLGFPIVVAMFLLVRMEKVIANLTTAVTDLTAVVARLLERENRASR